MTFEPALVADLEASYRRFLVRTTESLTVFVLVSQSGRGATVDSRTRRLESGEPLPVELAFSDYAYARRIGRVHFREFEAHRLSLDEYCTALQSMHDRLVIPNPTKACGGLEATPAALRFALIETLNGRPPQRLPYIG